ncbi:hypothetical protein GCM10009720_16250 [Yaniella flava]|uniref:Uncharacterized protein n=1 Tax=Yaniella flava TaxID=287930 RepID=A0ABP5G2S4_9MICC
MSQHLATTDTETAFAALKDAWILYRDNEDQSRGIPADASLYSAELKHLLATAGTARTETNESSQEATSHHYPPMVVNAVADILAADIPAIGAAEPYAHSVLSTLHDVSRIYTIEQLHQLPPETYVKTKSGTLRWAEFADDFDLPATVVDWGA